MKFGYFTLSDNRYPNNSRSPEQFLVEIRDQAVLAEKLGLNSAWIGEHHFNRRGCVSVPAVVLANVAAATRRLRLGPAVVVRPIHHPIHVAEEWATLDQLSGDRRNRSCFGTEFGSNWRSDRQLLCQLIIALCARSNHFNPQACDSRDR
jgi:hypothetical protein